MVKWYFPSIVIDLFEFEGRENKYQNKCPSAWDFFIIKCIIKMYKWIYSRKNHKKLPTSDIKQRKRGKIDQKLTKNELDFTTIKIDEFRTSERCQIGKSKKRKWIERYFGRHKQLQGLLYFKNSV